MNLDQLPINLFDVVLIAVLAAGIFEGRKHGMSEELLSLLMWLAIVFGSVCLLPGLVLAAGIAAWISRRRRG